MPEISATKVSPQEVEDSRLYPIRTVSTLTGVNAVTLRAWERRYGLIQPQRTPKGHRLYTQHDIDLINQVLELLDKGISISQVKNHLKGSERSSRADKASGPWEQYEQRMVNAVVRFDGFALDRAYNEALSLYPIDLVTQRLVVPLLRTLGERWENAQGSVAEEHFFGSYLRNKLGARFHHQVSNNRGPKVIAACLPGEYHEVGLLLFCLIAIEKGYQIVLLGANLPYSELPEVVRRTDARAVVLSGSIEPPAGVLQDQLAQLTARIDIPLLIGGKTSIDQRDAIVRAGAVPVGNDPGHGLRQLEELLSGEP